MNDQLAGSKGGNSSVNRLNQNSSSLDSKFGSNLDAKNQFADNVNPVTQLATQQTSNQNQKGGNNGASKLTSKTENKTGLPDDLKSGIEGLSGYSMDDVKVHYNSGKPAQLQALAYAQGTDIHVGPGQEQHLPHEAWHVVQQKQGRVRANKQLKGKGVSINDESSLEKEADVMGEKALSINSAFSPQKQQNTPQTSTQRKVIQREEDVDNFISWFDKHLPDSGKTDLNPTEIREFIDLQRDLKHDESDVVTMGPEFEFAKVTPHPVSGDLPIHKELLESTIDINGLPFVFETDAGNVIEAAFPPFTIGKKNEEDFKEIAYRAMRITSQIEKYLKKMAEDLAQGKKTLAELKNELERGLGVKLKEKDAYQYYSELKLLRFTKGIGSFTNEYISRDEVTNAQINITMGLDDLGAALQGATATRRGEDHMERKVATTGWLENKLSGEDKKYISILAYYISQIPMMALQNLMVQARQNTPDRDDFKASSETNAGLLSKLSSIKDFMGFWVKAGLNDVLQNSDELNDLLGRIDQGELEAFLLHDEKFTELWDEHGTALQNFDKGSGGVTANSYNQMVKRIVQEMFEMSKNITENEVRPAKSVDILPDVEKGQNVDSYTKFTEGADRDGNAAPFMARPDTHVAIPREENQFLVEVRGLNKGVLGNENMQSFYMPGFRLAGEEKDWGFIDYNQKSKEKTDSGYKSFRAYHNRKKQNI
ncbi:DUF4157 domain-containing protein, partial [Fulvivirga kasyanovii]